MASVNEPLRLEFLTGYRNDNGIQFWENALALRVIHRDLAFYARGSGAVGQSWAVDGTSYFGYAVNLTPDRTYKAMVIPLVGFSGHYEATFHQTWWGPYLGAGIRVEPGNRLIFDLGYAYNWLHPDSHGHTGWAQMDFIVDRHWNLGLFGQINYFFGHVQWTSVSGLAAISRSF